MDNGESSYRRFIEGDQSAFDELMDAYRDRLIFFIKGYVRSAEEAQDIAMDTFVEILVHPGRFRFKSSFKTYIYSVARHKAIDFLRKKRTVSDEGEEIWDESAIDSFYRGEDARTVRECMDRLNNDYRTVLYLVYFEEVDGDGAAKIMGKSKNPFYPFTFFTLLPLKVCLCFSRDACYHALLLNTVTYNNHFVQSLVVLFKSNLHVG